MDRAGDHIDTLKENVRDLLRVEDEDPQPYGFHFDPDSGEGVGWIEWMPDPPTIYWSLVAGDAVHNLRGALDHLMWQVAILDRGGGVPEDRTQFPIVDDPAHLTGWPASVTMNQLTEPHRTLVAGYQPYNAGDLKDVHPLAILRELSNQDKHRVLAILSLLGDCYVDPTTRDCVIEEGRPHIGVELKKGAEVVHIRTRAIGPNPELDVKLYVLPEITIGEDVPLIPLLDIIQACITGITAEFDPDFRQAEGTPK